MNLPRKILVALSCAIVIGTCSARPRRKNSNPYTMHRPTPSVPAPTVPMKSRNKKQRSIAVRPMVQKNALPVRRFVNRQQPAPVKKTPIIEQPSITPLNKELLRDNPIEHYKMMVINDVEQLLAHDKMEQAWAYLKSSDSILPQNTSPKQILEQVIVNARRSKNEHILDHLVNLCLSAPTSIDMNMAIRTLKDHPFITSQDFYMSIAKSNKLTPELTKDLDSDIQFHLLRHALQKNDLFATQNLLEAGINPNALDTNWVNKMYWSSLTHPDVYAARRPLEFAIDTNNPALVSLLLDYGSELDPVTDILNPHENSMLQRAIRRGKLTNNLNNSKKIISLLVHYSGWVPTCYANNMIFITKEEPAEDTLQNFYAQYETNKLETVFQVRSDLIAIAPEVKFSVK